MKPLDTQSMSMSGAKPTTLKADSSITDKLKQEQAAGQFECMLMLQLARELSKTLENSSLYGTMPGAHIYSGMADWQLAEMLSRSTHTGLKETILRQMQPLEEPTNETKPR